MSDGADFTTTQALVVIGVGFGGALLGAFFGAAATLTLDVWRRTLDGVAATRLIRMETIDNRTAIRGTLLVDQANTLNDDAWKQARIAIAPLMNEVELAKLWRDCNATPYMRGVMDVFHQFPTNEQLRAELERYRTSLQERAAELRRLEGRSVLVHMWRILRGSHLSTSAQLEAAFGTPAVGRGGSFSTQSSTVSGSEKIETPSGGASTESGEDSQKEQTR